MFHVSANKTGLLLLVLPVAVFFPNASDHYMEVHKILLQ